MKAKFEDVLEFALEAIDDPVIRPILDRQVSSPPTNDEESEERQMALMQRVNEMLKSRDVCWRLRSGYKDGLSITLKILNGELRGEVSIGARDILKNSPFIEFGEA